MESDEQTAEAEQQHAPAMDIINLNPDLHGDAVCPGNEFLTIESTVDSAIWDSDSELLDEIPPEDEALGGILHYFRHEHGRRYLVLCRLLIV